MTDDPRVREQQIREEIERDYWIGPDDSGAGEACHVDLFVPTRAPGNPDDCERCGQPRHAHLLQYVLAQLDAARQAENELSMIDNVMARRPALDRPTRWQNIEKALSMAGRADGFERKLKATEQRAEAAEARLRDLETQLKIAGSQRLLTWWKA